MRFGEKNQQNNKSATGSRDKFLKATAIWIIYFMLIRLIRLIRSILKTNRSFFRVPERQECILPVPDRTHESRVLIFRS